MISSVRGTVTVRRVDHVVIEAAGVGYRLAVSGQTLKSVPGLGKGAHLHAHLIPRDDSMQLYGFATEEERELFLMLTSVAGVGPKVAIAVLSASAPRELLRAIGAGDAERFHVVPGVGKKTADRIIVELREKVASDLPAAEAGGAASEDPRIAARAGLVGLGYTLAESESMLDGAGGGETAEELIAKALRSAVAAREK